MSPRRTQQGSPARKQSSQRLIKLFTGCFLLLLALAVARLFTVQILQAKALAQKGENQRITQLSTAAQRGTIYDRSGNVLAKSVLVYDVSADPTLIHDKTAVAERLRQAFGGTSATYLDLLRRKGHYVVLARKVDTGAAAAFRKSALLAPSDSAQEKKLKEQLQTFAFSQDYKRVYPGATIAAQVVGFVNADGKGVAGIELQYDKILRGTPGVSFSERDQSGNPIPSGIQKTIAPKPGRDIILTVDSAISYYAQQKLDATVEAHGAVSGAVVVMNPKTGDLYAAASTPSFDPNNLDKVTNEAVRDRALVDLYEPGSTFKTVTLAGSLQSGAVTPQTTFSVPGSLQIGDHVVKDAEQHGVQTMSVTDIIRQSSNIGATRIAGAMGLSAYYQTLTDFGLDKDSGIDFPGSTKGYLAPQAQWTDIGLSNASFGQGISLTPVSLARCIAAAGNGGVLVTPHFLADVPGDHALTPDWAKQNKQILSASVSAEVTRILEGVVTIDHLEVPGFVSAGKSGTAQMAEQGKGYVEGRYASSFVGYLPADDPQVLCLVVIFQPSKNGYYGASVAGPTYADILRYATSQLKITASGKSQPKATGGTDRD